MMKKFLWIDWFVVLERFVTSNEHKNSCSRLFLSFGWCLGKYECFWMGIEWSINRTVCGKMIDLLARALQIMFCAVECWAASFGDDWDYSDGKGLNYWFVRFGLFVWGRDAKSRSQLMLSSCYFGILSELLIANFI